MLLVIIFVAGLWAGLQNALAGGGSFVTLPALMLTGMSPLAANITSTVALFPGQVTAGLAGRKLVTGAGALPFRALFVVSILGGAVGGLLLLKTPSSVFARLVPWLVLFATVVFTWGSFFRKPGAGGTSVHLGPLGTAFAQFVIAIYGGYFGGGIGFLMLAALTMAGLPTRNAGATKNVLAGVMNASAVALFFTSPQLHWREAIVLGSGAIIGGLCGSWALHRVNEKALRIAVVCIGVALTIGLFVRPI
ncbi:sulfite exporter TauE/SafE family protein [Noviherbaspirillum sp. CPCC 100848]|uniref:Probable membrane transporter protein n=1 Tax=Noviherbaspirillum album TaxID=3080276 RepID=A0ABU6JH79_9BURK|nr:sulfite exporter TauE/SafE family protein [Noviherbaspirillum sp. CPCC 100848]MEC4722547.1 sulfite exporter TauE/SafE family protein [Noviherbaspirillum sp. CPCC 100848]